LVNPKDVIIFTSQTVKRRENRGAYAFLYEYTTKEQFDNKSMVLICTYSMLSYSGARTDISNEVMKFISGHEWGLMLLDEVQVVPAQKFSKITDDVKAHCKLGLTATLVREDGKIEDLHF
jgi:DNA excision repair protein ERCC-3